MSAPARHHRVLLRLKEEGALAQSEVSGSLREALAPLIATGVLRWERAGSGQRLRIIEEGTFVEFLRRSFPDAPSAVTSARVQSVGRFRDSKVARGAQPQIVCARGWSNGHLLRGSVGVDVVTSTLAFGVFSFVLDDETEMTLRGRVALAENPAFFLAFEHLGLDVPLCIYTQGCFTRRLLAWLVRNESCEVLHCGDYDPTGLAEYHRLRRALGDRVTFHVPANLNALFRNHSKSKLLESRGSQQRLARLRDNPDSTIRAIVGLIDNHNAGLEQEALLLGCPPRVL